MFSRRSILKGAAGTAGAALIPGLPALAGAEPVRLVAAPGRAGLVVPEGPATDTWLYNGVSPGPEIRALQGETLTVEVENQLPEPTTVHWHGLRVPIEQDGVPFISQAPISPGERFTYELPLEDAGTFWYHPHINSSEQVGRGLYGLLIVEEPPEIAARLGADREIAWALDDWRLDREAQIMPFGNWHDFSHGGRIGNVLTINGTYHTRTRLRAGERVRLRVANVANAQTFRLQFSPFDPWVIALDGHPVPPHRLADAGLWLAAGQRADLIIDVALEPGTTARVIDDAYGPDRSFEVMTWEVSDDPPLRERPLPDPVALPANPIEPPNLRDATRTTLVFEGGAMGGMGEAMMGGRMRSVRELAEAGRFWAINGEVPVDLADMPPLLSAPRGSSQILSLENRTSWIHPIHLHGHSVHVLEGGRETLDQPIIRDTVLLAPRESATVAFVADNPGKWMLHCHVLEHQASGMMGVVEVT